MSLKLRGSFHKKITKFTDQKSTALGYLERSIVMIDTMTQVLFVS